jgi:hypothetical protein
MQLALPLQSALAAVDLLGFWNSPYQDCLVEDLDSLAECCSMKALEFWW